MLKPMPIVAFVERWKRKCFLLALVCRFLDVRSRLAACVFDTLRLSYRACSHEDEKLETQAMRLFNGGRGIRCTCLHQCRFSFIASRVLFFFKNQRHNVRSKGGRREMLPPKVCAMCPALSTGSIQAFFRAG